MTDINDMLFPSKGHGDIVLHEDGKYYQYDEENDLWEEIDNPND